MFRDPLNQNGCVHVFPHWERSSRSKVLTVCHDLCWSYCIVWALFFPLVHLQLPPSATDPVLATQMDNYHSVRPPSALLNHSRIQKQNPVIALFWKNRITLAGKNEIQNAFTFLLYLHSTYKEKKKTDFKHVHITAHTLTHSSFIQNSAMTHGWRGEYCLWFGFS